MYTKLYSARFQSFCCLSMNIKMYSNSERYHLAWLGGYAVVQKNKSKMRKITNYIVEYHDITVCLQSLAKLLLDQLFGCGFQAHLSH